MVTIKALLSIGAVALGTTLAVAQSADNPQKNSNHPNVPDVPAITRTPAHDNDWGWFGLLALAGVPGLFASLRKRRQSKQDKTGDQGKAT
jgi:hypothetical protein